MTTIAQINGKWYVVKSQTSISGMFIYVPVSKAYDTSAEARVQQAAIVFGRA